MKKALFVFLALLWASVACAQFPTQREYVATTGGSGNAQTALVPNYTLNVGVPLWIRATYSNTGAMTLNVNGTGAQPVQKVSSSGLTALVGGEVVANQIFEVVWDGAEYELILSAVPAGVTPSVNVQTAGYTVQSTDCGNTVQMGVGGTGSITLTFPSSLTGFVAYCKVVVLNGDTARLKPVVNVSGLTWLYPQQYAGSVQVNLVNGIWEAVNAPLRYRPSVTPSYYVDNVSGSDSNDCLATGSGNACFSWQGAYNRLAQTIDWNGGISLNAPVIYGKAGQTYTTGITISGGGSAGPSSVPPGLTAFVMDGQNSTISCGSSPGCIPIYIRYAAIAITSQNLTLVATASDLVSVRGGGAFYNIGAGMTYGSANSIYPQILAYGSGQIATCIPAVCPTQTGVTVTGGGGSFLAAQQGAAIQFEGVPLNFANSVTYSTGVVSATDNSAVSFFNATISSSVGAVVTGDQYSVTKGSVVDINAQTGSYSNCSVTYLPGTLCGQTYSNSTMSNMGAPTVTGAGTGATIQQTEPYFTVVLGTGLPSTSGTAVTATITFSSRTNYQNCTVTPNNAVVLNDIYTNMVAPTSSANGQVTVTWTANGTAPAGYSFRVNCQQGY